MKLAAAFLSIAAITLLSLGACSQTEVVQEESNDPDREEWVSLFNGENLDGWTVKIAGHEVGDNYADTFRVEDGILRAAYDAKASGASEPQRLFFRARPHER